MRGESGGRVPGTLAVLYLSIAMPARLVDLFEPSKVGNGDEIRRRARRDQWELSSVLSTQ
jgi:hypothetical protein